MHNRLKAKLWSAVEVLVVVLWFVVLGVVVCYWAWRLIDRWL